MRSHESLLMDTRPLYSTCATVQYVNPCVITHHPVVIKDVAAVGVDGQADAHRLVHTLLPLTLVAVGSWGVTQILQQTHTATGI
jgi:hypothetical protein